MDKNIDLMKELIEKIQNLNYHYYTLDEPVLSDKEYDLIYDKLVKLEEETGEILENSPTQKVGGRVLEKFKKHNHLGRLWSLDKAQSFDELFEWEKRVLKLINDYNVENENKLPKPEYILEYKFDGLTINLTYENGKLVQSATRGNGIIGEGILAQVEVIKSIPKDIKFDGIVEIQGEGLMPLSQLEKYNETHEEPLKNARNAAAGALRNLDASVTNERNLVGYFYNVGYIQGQNFTKHTEMLEFLRENYIPVYPYMKKFNSIKELVEEIDYQDIERKTLDILTDGMVIKINDIRTRDILGYTNKFPRWAVAYKFEAEEMTTRLLDVIWNVGTTGKLTPTAILEAVEIGGATIQRATLNNYDDIERKKVRINSKVLIRRSNDVIPEILGTIEDDTEETFTIEKPSVCPSCGMDLVQDGVHIFCKNSYECKPQLVSKLVHFASRDAMNIEGFSEKTAELLEYERDLREIPQLYELKYEDLIGLDGFKEKKTNNLLEAIEKSKDIALNAFIYALGINNVGIKTATDLANYYKTLENLRLAEFDELITVGEVGEVIATSLLEFFKDEKTSGLIDKLLEHGVRPYFEEVVVESSIFSEKTVVITGTIQDIPRKDIKELVEKMGGKVTGSVSKKTDFVIVGESAGSKYDKALELGIDIIEEEQLKELLKI